MNFRMCCFRPVSGLHYEQKAGRLESLQWAKPNAKASLLFYNSIACTQVLQGKGREKGTPQLLGRHILGAAPSVDHLLIPSGAAHTPGQELTQGQVFLESSENSASHTDVPASP